MKKWMLYIHQQTNYNLLPTNGICFRQMEIRMFLLSAYLLFFLNPLFCSNFSLQYFKPIIYEN